MLEHEELDRYVQQLVDMYSRFNKLPQRPLTKAAKVKLREALVALSDTELWKELHKK